MSEIKRGCHVRSKIPVSTYTFKWSIEHFSKLLIEKVITSPDFYPCSDIKWYSTLQKFPSYIKWTMHNPTSQNVFVKHNISILDTSGKLWIKKKLHRTYENGNNRCVLIDSSDAINTTDFYRLTKDVVTFSCIMTFTGQKSETQIFELESEEIDERKYLKKLSNNLKVMYGASLYTDICLRIGSDSLRAHRAILCSRSPVFAKMFAHKLEERETSVIDIDDLDMNVLKDLITFLYTACVPNENFDSVFALYYAADKYDVEDLRNFCREVMLSKLTVDNACQVLSLADRHSDVDFKASVLTFMDIHMDPILATEEWIKFVNKETKLAAEVIRKHTESKSLENSETVCQEDTDEESSPSVASRQSFDFQEIAVIPYSSGPQPSVRRPVPVLGASSTGPQGRQFL